MVLFFQEKKMGFKVIEKDPKISRVFFPHHVWFSKRMLLEGKRQFVYIQILTIELSTTLQIVRNNFFLIRIHNGVGERYDFNKKSSADLTGNRLTKLRLIVQI